ncbi:MAG: DUF6456 domain-containing protein [Parvibaculum sp.]|jgi:hypothetical protein|uniref:DUF6456 domain-containing protein n=1 Tax=Parvibaculum sp. TaxID=2024848 RepID=UPI00283CC7F2|nr:DUF6456 domain-containing protein [Parvibaculum sp.]MDR3497778.1 DUF6456 domain-containing protein [Parvibaculum sp.]
MSLVSEHEVEREVRRVFRRFAEPQSFAAPDAGGVMGLFIARNRWRRPVAHVEARLWSAFEHRDFVRAARQPAGDVWHPSETGLAYWRRLEAESDPFRAQHQMQGRRLVAVDGKLVPVAVNEAETSLDWLRRRKGPDGKPLVNEHAFDAGEKLRRDFSLARMSPRVTTDWSLALAPGGGGRKLRDPSDVSDRALAARERLARALHAVGPGLSDILVEVCCHARGLEESERRFGWPQRSAKIVLQIALDRLAAHYAAKGK